MNSSINIVGGGISGLALLAICWGLFTTIFWMVCAWRAMRAHEKIAEKVDELSRK